MPRTIHVRDDVGGQPLEAGLRKWLGSAGAQGDLVRARRVTLNGNLCTDAGRPLRSGDVVKILEHPQSEPPKASDVTVRYVDDHLLVVEKPAGMTTMRYGNEVSASGRRDRLPTLLDLLPSVVAHKLATSGPPKTSRSIPHGRPRPAAERRQALKPIIRPVHRLDRDTSGLMVFARSPAAEATLTQMFRDHAYERIYEAVVEGRIEAQTIETYLADDRGDGKRGSVADPSIGKKAVTHVRPVEHFGSLTLVECRLETGRTHQIRIHLAERGHPLCGDKDYRAPYGSKPVRDTSGSPRLALHAGGLSFKHPVTGKPLDFHAPLPKDLAAFVRRLRKDARKSDARHES